MLKQHLSEQLWLENYQKKKILSNPSCSIREIAFSATSQHLTNSRIIRTKIAKKTEDSRNILKPLTDGLANSVIFISAAQGSEAAAPKPSKFQSSRMKPTE
jgi:hypothetical protein